MPTPLIQPSFAAGEVAPALHARVDLAKYRIGLATCLNWFIKAQGGAYNRMGSRFVDGVIDPAVRSRNIPFQFKTTQTYCLEFGHLKMRVVKDGAYVLEAAKTITGITQANPAVVTSNAHGFSNGDEVYIADVVGMTELNGRRFTVAGVTANTFQLLGEDSTGHTAYSSAGTASRYYTLTTPYIEADLPTLKFVQSADTMTITHPGYAPRDLTRTGHAAWTLTAITFAAEQAAPTGVTATPSSASADETYEYVVTAINATTGEESLASSAGSTTFKFEHNWDPTTGDKIVVTWTDAAGAGSYNVYKKRNGIYGFLGNAAAGATGFKDDKIKANTADTPPGSRNPFSGASEYPGAVAYHEERRFFGGSLNKPQTVWATGSGSYKNMNVSSPTKDDDAITRTLVSRQVNEIRHIVSMGVLVILTSGAEWRARPDSNSSALTPASFDVKPQSYSGASHVPPILANDSLIFIQEKGSVVRDLRYQFASDGYAGVDLSILAAHLFEGHSIVDWCYAQVPHNLIVGVRDDGVLLFFSYLKEQEVYAWARAATAGEYESVCSVSEGAEDAVYATVKRVIDGATVRYQERFASRRFDSIRDAWFLDCALEYDGNNAVEDDYLKITGASYAMGASVTLQATGHTPFTAALVGRKYELRVGAAKVRVTVTAYTDTDTVTATLDTNAAAALQAVDTADWALLATTITGLWHLIGEEVHILGDGNIMVPQAVSAGGSITLERAVSKAIVGLPYDCDLETLNIDAGQPTVQGKLKRVGKVTLKVEETRGLSVGPVALDSGGNYRQGVPGALVEIKERSTEGYGEPIQPFTGDRDVVIDPSWNTNGRIFVRATPGLPAAVLAVIPEITA